MQTIFRNTMATGKFAKYSSAALGKDDENKKVMPHASTKRLFACDDNAATSSSTKTNKKAKNVTVKMRD
jgi:spore germination cell wall hydrolase CwlJ-like protein